jgi:uncharacterized membrane protein YdjX (TVP38/TMEM64 family)
VEADTEIGRGFWSRPRLVGLVLIGIVLLGLILMNVTPLRSLLARTELLGAWFTQRGLFGMALYITGVTLLVCLGVPRLLLCSIGGMAFGFWQGLMLTQAGTALGFYVVFNLVRHAGWSFSFLRHRPNMNAVQKRIGKGGVMSVFGIRMMPLSGFYSTIMMGMLPLRHDHFLLGTFLGTFPQAIPATLIGAGATQDTLQTSIAFIVTAVIAFVTIWFGINAYRRKMHHANPPLTP